MKYLKRKQIIVFSLVLMLVVAGYLQYSVNKASQYSEEDPVGDAVYVQNSTKSEDEEGDNTKNDQKSATASKEVNSFFAQAKMERDSTRGKDIETMKGITEDQLATKEARSKAQEKMMKLVDTSQKEVNIENLIKGKGFSDAIALFAEDGSVDVVVKTPSISKEDEAKIVDIVSRQGNVSFDKIIIKQMY